MLIDGNTVTANGTTLGADNGMGVALIAGATFLCSSILPLRLCSRLMKKQKNDRC
jgi:hypothetical protein